ncbi:MAG: hypothetical protein KAW56_14440, partial [Candidatus Marinimicrobia bacterium]|nr:hypothetical protein [Candidatus Neomarinimicrobiota bacterium]
PEIEVKWEINELSESNLKKRYENLLYGSVLIKDYLSISFPNVFITYRQYRIKLIVYTEYPCNYMYSMKLLRSWVMIYLFFLIRFYHGVILWTQNVNIERKANIRETLPLCGLVQQSYGDNALSCSTNLGFGDFAKDLRMSIVNRSGIRRISYVTR